MFGITRNEFEDGGCEILDDGCIEAVDELGSVASLANQVGGFEDIEVVAERGRSEVKRLSDFAGVEFTFGEEAQNFPTIGVGDSFVGVTHK